MDFSCFTNAYSKSSILYQVLIFPSQKSAGASITSANVWLHVVGSLAESAVLRFVYIFYSYSFTKLHFQAYVCTKVMVFLDLASGNDFQVVSRQHLNFEILFSRGF